MAQRATSLGPKPSLLVFFVLLLFLFYFFGGFKGQVRWPKGLLVFLCFFFALFAFNRENLFSH